MERRFLFWIKFDSVKVRFLTEECNDNCQFWEEYIWVWISEESTISGRVMKVIFAISKVRLTPLPDRIQNHMRRPDDIRSHEIKVHHFETGRGYFVCSGRVLYTAHQIDAAASSAARHVRTTHVPRPWACVGTGLRGQTKLRRLCSSRAWPWWDVHLAHWMPSGAIAGGQMRLIRAPRWPLVSASFHSGSAKRVTPCWLRLSLLRSWKEGSGPATRCGTPTERFSHVDVESLAPNDNAPCGPHSRSPSVLPCPSQSLHPDTRCRWWTLVCQKEFRNRHFSVLSNDAPGLRSAPWFRNEAGPLRLQALSSHVAGNERACCPLNVGKVNFKWTLKTEMPAEHWIYPPNPDF